MAEEKRTDAVSRKEFYSAASGLSLMPAMLVMASSGPPDSPARQIAFWLILAAMVGMSLTYSAVALWELRLRSGG
jgi:hypothetical protein